MPKIIITESGTEPMRGALRAAASRLASRTASASGRTRGAATASTSAPSSPSDPNLDDVPTDVSTLEPGATFTRTRAFTAHDVAGTLGWTRHEHAYETLDVFSRGMAAMETKAHLDLLVARGQATATPVEDGVRYTAVGG